MSMSNYLENKDLDVWYGKSFSTIPATVYLDLHSGDPGETGTSNVIGIARAAVTNNSTNWPAASGGSKSNGTQINFGSTAGQYIGVLAYYVSIWDAATNGNMLDYGALTAPVAVGDKQNIYIAVGGLTIVRS